MDVGRWPWSFCGKQTAFRCITITLENSAWRLRHSSAHSTSPTRKLSTIMLTVRNAFGDNADRTLQSSCRVPAEFLQSFCKVSCHENYRCRNHLPATRNYGSRRRHHVSLGAHPHRRRAHWFRRELSKRRGGSRHCAFAARRRAVGKRSQRHRSTVGGHVSRRLL